jgi:predicted sulfurtransferase
MISTNPRILTAAAALLVVSLIATFSALDVRAANIAFVRASDDARRIKPDEARDLLKEGKAVLVDVRGESAYKAGHIKSAINIPASEMRDRAKELPRDKMIITYCS